MTLLHQQQAVEALEVMVVGLQQQIPHRQHHELDQALQWILERVLFQTFKSKAILQYFLVLNALKEVFHHWLRKESQKASISNVKSSENTISLDFSHSGEDPITPGVLTPALDVHFSLSITEDMDMGVLSINGSLPVIVFRFPSTEAFIVDQPGNGKVFLGAQMEQGGVIDLYGDNKEPLFKVNIQVQFDSEGNFTGVQEGDKRYTVDEWNKHVEDSFKRNQVSHEKFIICNRIISSV